MLELVLIADDLTGALDAAAPLIGAGVEVRTVASLPIGLADIDNKTSVLSVNAETRHLPAGKARSRVAALVAEAVGAGVPIIVKKTDSVLRGNIGAELEGALSAHPADTLHFLPSLPAMGRVTRDGTHYIGGVPVALSELGSDPFEPVVASRVADIIGSQSTTPVAEVASGGAISEIEGVAVYDAVSEADLDCRIGELVAGDRPLLLAGCMGLVASLARFIAPRAQMAGSLGGPSPVLAFCGSVNPVSVAQCAFAREAAVPTHALSPRRILTSSWPRTAEFDQLVCGVASDLKSASLVVIDASTRAGDRDVKEAGLVGIEDLRSLTAANLGALAGELLVRTAAENVLIMGGDVLLSLLGHLDVTRLRLVAELAPGVVVSEAVIGGRTVRLISKSGGFGEPDLFLRVAERFSKAPAAPLPTI